MKKYVFFVSGIALLVFLAGCGFGLSPAWNASTGIAIELGGALPDDGSFASIAQDRAMVQVSGALYLQLGTGKSARLFGPYDAEPGTRLRITGIQPGEYSDAFLYYAPHRLTFAAPPILSSATAVENLRTAIDNLYETGPVADEVINATTFADLGGLRVIQGQVNTVRASLIPITRMEISVFKVSQAVFLGEAATNYPSYTLLPLIGDPGKIIRTFVRLTDVGDDLVPGEVIDFLHCYIHNTDGVNPAWVGSVAIFKENGKRVLSASLNDTLDPGKDAAAPAPYFSGSVFYMYVEYSAANLDIKFASVLAE